MQFGLIFDVDGVLADTEPLSIHAINQAFLELYNVAPKDVDSDPYMGVTAEVHVLGIAMQYGISIDVEKMVERQLHHFLKELGGSPNIGITEAANFFNEASRFPSWKLALATSSKRKRSEATLLACGLDTSKLSAWLTGDDITKAKPDPEIYQAAALALGVPTERCVVIEDSITGITSAKAAGMACIAVTGTFSGEELRQADRIVDTLANVNMTLLHDLIHEGNTD